MCTGQSNAGSTGHHGGDTTRASRDRYSNIRSGRESVALVLSKNPSNGWRHVVGRGTGIVGYNVQTAVDMKHHLIVAHEVTNVGHDRTELASMAKQGAARREREDLTIVADRGEVRALRARYAGPKSGRRRARYSARRASYDRTKAVRSRLLCLDAHRVREHGDQERWGRCFRERKRYTCCTTKSTILRLPAAYPERGRHHSHGLAPR